MIIPSLGRNLSAPGFPGHHGRPDHRASQPFRQGWSDLRPVYPLVNIAIAIENGHSNSEFSH